MSEVDEYLSKVDDPQKSELERVRRVILDAVPDAQEVITYGMPGFKYKRKYLIAYAPFKDHMSVFPGSRAIEKLQDKLGEFKISKGTIQFTSDNPLPDELIKELVTDRRDEITHASK